MRVHKILKKTYAEGPGQRYCIWVQGCSHGCEDCFATELWDYSLGTDISAKEIIEDIKTVLTDIEGITFLGGEPFDKAGELAEIARWVKEQGKNVIAFSGYVLEELISEDQKLLLSYTDVLLDGEFKKELLDYSRPLVGSSNQRIIFLTDDIDRDVMMNYENRIEVRTDKNGRITFNGMGNIQKLQEVMRKIK